MNSVLHSPSPPLSAGSTAHAQFGVWESSSQRRCDPELVRWKVP